jgi:hypothetical protein
MSIFVCAFCHMGCTITVQLSRELVSRELAAWPKTIAVKTGVSHRKLVRDQVENAKACSGAQGFMRPAATALSRSTARTSVSRNPIVHARRLTPPLPQIADRAGTEERRAQYIEQLSRGLAQKFQETFPILVVQEK